MLRIPFAIVLAIVSIPALADVQAGEEKARLCLICHQPGFTAATLPTLEGQPAEYLRNQIVAFREKRRGNTIMQHNVRALSDEDVRDIVEYFSSIPPIKVKFGFDPAMVADGRSRAETGNCSQCHRPDYSGGGEVPRLAGMDPAYSASQIMAFIRGDRKHPAIDTQSGLSAADAASLAQFFAQVE